jgi:hypothetical protein
MRIDSSGNLLVGKATTDVGTQGVRIDNTGRGFFTRDSSLCLQANRLSSDGEIVRFSKDGTTVGSIGSASGNRIYIGTGNSTLGFSPVVNAVYGYSGDNTVDLGTSATRFKDLYLSGGLRGDTLTFSNLAGSERMRIDSSGHLLVGKAATGLTNDGAMDFIGGQSSYGGVLGIYHSTINVSGSGFINFARHTAYIGSITQNGTTGVSYNTTSDYRLKENVIGLTNATTRLKQLEPKRFNFIADANRTVDGFLAHEVQTVVPEAITGTHNEVDADGNPVYQGIDQSKLVPLLVATIKELEARITALENA